MNSFPGENIIRFSQCRDFYNISSPILVNFFIVLRRSVMMRWLVLWTAGGGAYSLCSTPGVSGEGEGEGGGVEAARHVDRTTLADV